MKHERNLQNDLRGKEARAFYVEAAINEEGPRKLCVIPADEEFIIYDKDSFLAAIKPEGIRDWEVSEGGISRGIANIIGKEIHKVT